MPITFEVDVEKDYLYKRGIKKGIEQGKEEIVKKEEEFKEKIQKKEEEFKEKIQKKEEELREEFTKKETQILIGSFKVGNDVKTIAEALNISQKRVKQIIKEWKQSS